MLNPSTQETPGSTTNSYILDAIGITVVLFLLSVIAFMCTLTAALA